MKTAILYNKFLDARGETQKLGGVETYILNLARTCLENGIETCIYQYADVAFHAVKDGIPIQGIRTAGLSPAQRREKLYNAAWAELDPREDVLIFGADHQSVPARHRHCVSIQHGVFLDLPAEMMTPSKLMRYAFLRRLKKRRVVNSQMRYTANCRNIVCVDHNFLNWYRTACCDFPVGRFWVILNFTRIPDASTVQRKLGREKNGVDVLFARRFVPQRGVRLMTTVAQRLLGRYADLRFTFAGEGPDQAIVEAALGNHPAVRLRKYLPDEALGIALEHDVSVIPSLASEGTSLSVAEGMAAGCAVVATNVGGITNMIIDGFNGVLCQPAAEDVEQAIQSLMDNRHRIGLLGKRAYETAAESFSIDRWKSCWLKVIREVAEL